ncbi:IS66 family transposase [Flavobacterium ovatum]|uniref:IS66 family transposase n=1 Tax=Flavobacterium ovatum TaxID=1928857 RepID=UPI00344EC9FB
MKITNEILHAVIHCNHKAFLKKVQGNQLPQTEFQTIFETLKQKQQSVIQTKLSLDFQNIDYSSNLKFEKGKTYLQISFKNAEVDLKLDGIYYDHRNSFAPILISPFEKVQKSDKLFIALQSHYLQQNFNLKIEEVRIIFGSQQKSTKVILRNLSKDVKKIIATIEQIKKFETHPVFYKISHCQVCEFNPICIKKLQERDDLSLLGNLKPKEIEQKNNRGIFSVKQLSYNFRPKKNPYRRRKFLPELKALAIREQKVFIQKLPELVKKTTEIFFDIESIPDRDFYYLIGVIVKTENSATEYSFWANNVTEQQNVFIQFIDLINTQNDFILYHYGSYEIQVLKRIAKKVSLPYQNRIKKIIENSFNVLTLFSNDIYTPTYTNGLKDIGNYMEFNWTDEKASGLQSIIWRYNWELNPTNYLKEKLITYNIEDCRALIKVQEWLISLSENNDQTVLANSIKQQNIFKWGVTVFALEHFNEINAKAYFDYQRQHVFLRTERKVYKAISKTKQTSKQYNRIDKKINLFPDKCEKCSNKDIKIIRSSKKPQIDLVFMKSGIKKQVIEYQGGAYFCKNCKKNFMVEDMRRLPTYGYNLMLWSVNQKIQYKLSTESIINLLKDSFNIGVSATQMTRFKEIIATKYEETYNEIIKKMSQSKLIHTDETIARINGIDGYVWVFANYDSVYYQFRETREPEFLKELLRDFKGVLVSDFYTGYDSMECEQQKCLVHLIRDLNEDFMKHQLDEEFKQIISEFGNLLRNIIATIDKYGLKKFHLNKHKKEVEKFYKKVILPEFESDLAISYQKRFIKYKEKLFLFLNHDGIPWNNNNAEHSIKPFAKWRKKVSKSLSKKNIEHHLILLSILQTCKYQGTNFFEFLKSGKKSIYEYSEK